MNVANKIQCFLFPAVFSFAQPNPICSGLIEAATEAEITKAEKSAIDLIAFNVNSEIRGYSKSERTVDGVEAGIKDTTIQKMSYELLNPQAVVFKTLKTPTGYSVGGCISVQDAAKPYLDSLWILSKSLKEQTKKITSASCKGIYDARSNMNKLERVLEPLVKRDGDEQKKYLAIKDEYSATYAEAETECNKDAKGVYVESNDVYFARRLSSLIANYGCLGTAENSALTLTVNSSECEQKPKNPMNLSFCSACVGIDLRSNKTGNPLDEDTLTVPGGGVDMKSAYKKAVEKAVPEVWEKIKGKISKGDCQ